MDGYGHLFLIAYYLITSPDLPDNFELEDKSFQILEHAVAVELDLAHYDSPTTWCNIKELRERHKNLNIGGCPPSWDRYRFPPFQFATICKDHISESIAYLNMIRAIVPRRDHESYLDEIIWELEKRYYIWDLVRDISYDSNNSWSITYYREKLQDLRFRLGEENYFRAILPLPYIEE